MSSAVADIKVERKRHEIETNYQLSVDVVLKKYDFQVRLLKVELQMHCHVLKVLRDAALLDLEGEH